jgi:hypothetical protein
VSAQKNGSIVSPGLVLAAAALCASLQGRARRVAPHDEDLARDTL